MIGGVEMKQKARKESDTIITDPFGSYTGKPIDPNEKPIQDADDL